MAPLAVYSGGRATFGMPSGMRLVVSVPFGIGLEMRKTGATILIRWRQGSFAFMMHLGAW